MCKSRQDAAYRSHSGDRNDSVRIRAEPPLVIFARVPVPEATKAQAVEGHTQRAVAARGPRDTVEEDIAG